MKPDPKKITPGAATSGANQGSVTDGAKHEGGDTCRQAHGGKRFTFPPPDAPNTVQDYSIGAPDQFPIDAFPPKLRGIAQELAAVYQTPVCLSAMASLAITSAAVGSSVEVEGAYKDKRTRLNLYVIAAAERGSGKGNVGETLTRVICRRAEILAEGNRDIIATRKGEVGLLRTEITRLERSSSECTGTELSSVSHLAEP
jgi:hypothetical protein